MKDIQKIQLVEKLKKSVIKKEINTSIREQVFEFVTTQKRKSTGYAAKSDQESSKTTLTLQAKITEKLNQFVKI